MEAVARAARTGPANRAAASTRPAIHPADAIALKIQEIEHRRRRIDLELMEAIVEADRTKAYEDYGHDDVAGFVSQLLGHGYQVSVTRAMVADVVIALPKTRQAFLEGRISYDHLRAICQVIDIETEQALLDEVVDRPVADAFKLVELIKQVEDSEVEIRRGVRFRKDRHLRTMVIEGVLPIEEGEAVKQTLDELAKEIPATEGGAHLSYRRADALLELTQGGAPKPAQMFVHADLDKLIAQGRLRVNLPHLEVARPQVPPTRVLEVDPPALEPGGDVVYSPGEVGIGAALEGGFSLSDATLDRLCCDSLIKLVTYLDGKPLDLGRAYRTVTVRQRRQLMLRDGRCVFPGCRRRSALEAHHLREYHRSGRTDIDNLALVCHAHHRKIHDNRWTLERVGGRFVVRRPDRPPIRCGGTVDSFRKAVLAKAAAPHPPPSDQGSLELRQEQTHVRDKPG